MTLQEIDTAIKQCEERIALEALPGYTAEYVLALLRELRRAQRSTSRRVVVKRPSLGSLGQDLLNAALAYRAAANKAGVEGAVIWLTGSGGELVIVTRGEYKDVLMRNIQERGPTLHFGCSVDEEAS